MPKNQTKRVVASPRHVYLGDVSQAEIMCGGDPHIGSPYANPFYQRAVKAWLEAEPNRYYILAGDLYEMALVGSKGDPYHTMPLDEAEKEAVQFLSSIKQYIICLIQGNHDERFLMSVGKDIVRDAADKAGVVYDGSEAYLTVQLGHWAHNSQSHNVPVTYCVYVTHGVGGGRTAGAKINNLLRLREIVRADIYVQGHQHDPVIKPMSTYEWTTSKREIVEVQQMFVVTSSALMRKGYAIDKAYAPTSMDIPILTLDGTRKRISARLESLDM